MDNNELYHHGVPKQKWGVRRYQNEDGSLTPLGREHYGYGIRRAVSNISNAIKKRKVDKQRKQALEKARKAKAEKAAYETERKRVIDTGTATEVMKYINTLSVDEKNNIAKRLEADKKLMDYASNEAKAKAEAAENNSKWNKFDDFVKKVEKAGEWAGKGVKVYNQSARIINTFLSTKLPVIEDKAKVNPKSSMMAANLVRKSSTMTVNQMEDYLERIEVVHRAEVFASGGSASKVNQKSNSDKDNKDNKDDKKKDNKNKK